MKTKIYKKLSVELYTNESIEDLDLIGIYRITIKGCNRYYIGSTGLSEYSENKGFKYRWRLHLSELLSNKHRNGKLQRAFNKYKNIEFSIVEVCKNDPSFIIEREQYYLNQLFFAQEFINKVNTLFKKLSLNISPIVTSPKYTKRKLNHKGSKRIKQFSLQGDFICTYVSAREANRELNISWKHISACCNGKRNIAGGYVWRFEDDSFEMFSIGKRMIKSKISQFTKGNKLIRIWGSITEINKEFPHIGNIYRCFKNRELIAYGYKWERIYE